MNINHFNSLLLANESAKVTKKRQNTASDALKITSAAQGALFRVSASLSAPEIVVAPIITEIYKMTVKFVKSLVDSTRQFHRWQHGTCILTPPQIRAEDEQPFIFSFNSDIVSSSSVVNSMSAVSQSIVKSFGALTRFLDTWRRYRPLWKVCVLSCHYRCTDD